MTLYLKKINTITHYLLRKPYLINKKINLILPKRIRLLIISIKLPSINNSLIKDILFTLNINKKYVFLLNPRQLTSIPNFNTNKHIFWYLGIKKVFNKNFTNIISPSFNNFYKNAEAKRNFWNQICQI